MPPTHKYSCLQAKEVVARHVLTGAEQRHPYDALVLAPGAAAIKPPLPGVDLPGIFQMKTVPDRWAPSCAAFPIGAETFYYRM
jgi:NAD(P)H-nitrite reductase large subunit